MHNTNLDRTQISQHVKKCYVIVISKARGSLNGRKFLIARLSLFSSSSPPPVMCWWGSEQWAVEPILNTHWLFPSEAVAADSRKWIEELATLHGEKLGLSMPYRTGTWSSSSVKCNWVSPVTAKRICEETCAGREVSIRHTKTCPRKGDVRTHPKGGKCGNPVTVRSPSQIHWIYRTRLTREVVGTAS